MYACILQGNPIGGSWGRQGQMFGGGTADGSSGGGAKQEGGGCRSGSGKRARGNGAGKRKSENGGGKREVCDPQSCNNTNIGVTPNS